MPIPEGQGPWRGARNFKYVWLDTYLPNVENNNSNNFYFMCKFN